MRPNSNAFHFLSHLDIISSRMFDDPMKNQMHVLQQIHSNAPEIDISQSNYSLSSANDLEITTLIYFIESRFVC